MKYNDIIAQYQKAVERIKQMELYKPRNLIVEEIGQGLVKIYFDDKPDQYWEMLETVWEELLKRIEDKHTQPPLWHPDFVGIALFGVPIIRKVQDAQQP